MFLAKCFRQSRPIIISYGSTTARRSASSSNGNYSFLPRVMVERANHFIEHWSPHAIPRYFKVNVMKDSVPKKARLETGEALLGLLLRKRFFDEALQISEAMRDLRMRFSAPIRAKMLTVNFIHSGVRGGTYFHNLESLLRTPEFSCGEDADQHFLDILHLLAYPGSSTDRLEKVVKIYLGIRGKDYRLKPSAIAVMIACHLAKGNEGDAERWLDYHSERPRPSPSKVDPTLCLPYTAYVQKQLVASPDRDPGEVYGPILERMSRDQAWPDTIFINMLMTAELQHGNLRQVLVLYETLRSHASQGVYPDETTYARLFNAVTAAARISWSREPRTRRTIIPKSRRKLFREMGETQLHLNYGHFPPLTPIITQKSLGAALQMFTVCKDYAAAIATLKLFERLHIPLEERVMDSVIMLIVARCKREIASCDEEIGNKPSWADIFLELRRIPRSRVKHVSDWDLRRRVLSVGRRTLAVVEARDKELAEVQGSKRTNESENSPVSSEIHKGESVRSRKKIRMREVRFQLIDVLLSRALEIKVLLKGHLDPGRPSTEALRNAFKAMLPNDEDVKREAFTRWKEDRTDIVQDPESESESGAPS